LIGKSLWPKLPELKNKVAILLIVVDEPRLLMTDVSVKIEWTGFMESLGANS